MMKSYSRFVWDDIKLPVNSLITKKNIIIIIIISLDNNNGKKINNNKERNPGRKQGSYIGKRDETFTTTCRKGEIRTTTSRLVCPDSREFNIYIHVKLTAIKYEMILEEINNNWQIFN